MMSGSSTISGPWNRGFPPCSLGVRGEMVPGCQSFSSTVGSGAIDPDGPGAGWSDVDRTP